MSSDESPKGELREIVYIDDASVNGHLSSMGVGLETGIDESSGTTEGGRKRFFGKINVPGLPLGIGGEGEKHKEEAEDIQKQIDITTPYRLQTLREIIESSESDIKFPAKEGVNNSDVVEITGTIEPMSLFRFELAEESILKINEATEIMTDAIEKIEGASSNPQLTDGNVVANEAIQEVAKELNDKRVPIRIDTESAGTFGASLNRNYMTIPENHAFSRPRQYTLFARVERRISANEVWEPTDTFRMGKHLTDLEDELENLSENLQEAAEGHGVKMDDKHLNIEGPAKIVHPIALYW